MRRRFDRTDFEWSIIEPLLPHKSRGVPRVDDRRVINGILWRFRTGSPWADIPERYGPYTTCYNRARAQTAGAFANIPAKRNRKRTFPFSAFLYRYRNLVERFFGKLKNARGLATRYDKRADNFLVTCRQASGEHRGQ